LPNRIAQPLRGWWRRPRALRWEDLRRIEPVSRCFGFDRGQPVDRYYIERFLEQHATDVRGRVLEVAEDSYTRRFGGNRVTRADILHANDENPKATLVGDLTQIESFPAEALAAFDCLLFTQTFLFIYDVAAAVRCARALLRPGGVLLATIAGISPISRYDADRWGDYWRFTEQSAIRLFGEVFWPENVTVKCHGNVLVACAFLQGLAAHELRPNELVYQDPDYPVVITVRAVKEGLPL
jgi:hypothetical protein